ncbi:hypothetical protein [Priestia megaterium]|uniref:hypothetical protein n=1 Tax=Priestia megaterium TaxID=1404 RepID=UPI0028549F79|nr:hypothetical protein [Priestia megaterium]MDR7202307.1 hypothetical protein [Priestia megaterium]MED3858183.1 hypothetical protein [Priestia megaterium]MED3901099.1 hypothetical protein [Priestia megaterium]
MLKDHMFEFYFDQMNELVFLAEVKNQHLYYKKMNKAAAKLVRCQGEAGMRLESVLPERVYHSLYLTSGKCF